MKVNLPGSEVLGILCDISGVLSESSAAGDGVAISGSAQAIKDFRQAGIKVKFVTNESARTRTSLHAKLMRLGFDMPIEDILTPAMAMMQVIKEQSLRPYLLVHPNVLEDFSEADTNDQNCVVIGDCAEHFSFQKMNDAFQVLLKSPTTPLYTLGKGKFYREDEHLQLDVGPFASALEFASERKAVICGKPDATFFKAGVSALGLSPENIVMVGDDIVSDVGGAQKAGLRGVLVKTGKYRPSDANHPDVKPDLIVDNLKYLADVILK